MLNGILTRVKDIEHLPNQNKVCDQSQSWPQNNIAVGHENAHSQLRCLSLISDSTFGRKYELQANFVITRSDSQQIVDTRNTDAGTGQNIY